MMIAAGNHYGSVGKKVEMFVPSTGHHCKMPDLPDYRYHHTLEAMTVCGGSYGDITKLSCQTLTDGSWEKRDLLQKR